MPRVSVIIPCYNEEKTIHLLLEAIYRQIFPRAELEVIIADGLSTDGTRREITAFQAGHADLKLLVVENHGKTIPSGLNRALAEAGGEIIVRLDAHSIPREDYIARCVAALDAGLGSNVGGVWEIRPGADTWIGRSIAAAAGHPLGVGDARYRIGGQAQAVDTVPFGAYRRSLVEQIGAYDESLLTNEDYEFNTRIRQAGGVVWMDPAIRTAYFSRPTLTALARQYWRYGFWKLRMLRRYPSTLRWRQMLPPLFVASVVALGAAALWQGWFGWLLVLELGVYALVLFLAGLAAAIRRGDPGLAAGLPLAIGVMHTAWGAGFLWSALAGSLQPPRST